jgi:putative FmdB family regulatory protein
LPTYEYRCVSCEHQFERFQRMSDEPIKVCEVCGEPVKRLLFPVAIQFKGKGFYSTDYARRSALGSVGSHAGGGDSDSSSERSTSSESGSPSDNGKSAVPEVSASPSACPTAKSD